MICPNCQAENRDGAKFCDECGFPLSGKIAKVAAAIEADEESILDDFADKTSANGESAEVPEVDISDNNSAGPKHAAKYIDSDEEYDTDEEFGTNEEFETDGEFETDEEYETKEEFEAPSSTEESQVSDLSSSDKSEASRNMSLPLIAVAGLNADEEGKPFDFSDIQLDDSIEDSDAIDQPSVSQRDEQSYAENVLGADAIQNDDGQKDSNSFDLPVVDEEHVDDEQKDADKLYENDEADNDASSFDLPEIDEANEDRDLPEISESFEDDFHSSLDEQPTVELPAYDEAHRGGSESIDSEKTEAYDDITTQLPISEEGVVDASYASSESAWRAGDTLEMPRVDGEEPAQEKVFSAPDPNAPKPKKKRGRNAVIIIIILLVVAAAVAGGTYYFELWGGKTLPDVVGRTQTDATVELEQLNFKVNVEQVKSDDTEGIVLSMDPGAGARLEEGTEVTIEVASSRIIPDVVGLQRDEAEELLKEEGFENLTFEEEKSDEKSNQVLSIDPEVGERGTSATEVTIKIATPYTVPDISGMSLDDAQSAIKKAGFKVSTEYKYDEDADEGTILSMDPKAGTELASGSTVTLSLAKSRASELIDAATSYLSSRDTIKIDGTTYQIDSVDDVSYEGDDTTSFTITARAATELDGETVYGSSKERSGTITWDSDNNVISID